ncbi:MAG: VanW family protein [Microgenomates group bacterium Gr01-1014_7]|nr:MAG: VanW family protein [Microgenomates group bacterium Gr01-1014_7]
MAKSKSKKIWPYLLFSPFLPAALSVILVILTLAAYQIILADKYYPFTFVGDTNISFLTEGQAIRKVQAKFDQRSSQKLQFGFAQGIFTIDIATASAKLDYSAFDTAFQSGRSGSTRDRALQQLQTLLFISKYSPKVTLSLGKQLDSISSVIDKQPQNAELAFNETTTPEGSPSASIQIKEGLEGLELDREGLEKNISDYILTGSYFVQLPVKSVPPKITSERVQKAKKVLEQSINAPVKLTFGDEVWIIDTKQLLTLLGLESQDQILNKEKTISFLKKIASEIDRDVQEGLFEFNPVTRRVSAFKASQEGRKLDIDNTYRHLSDALSGQGQKTIDLPVAVVKPKIQTSAVNSLGIKELIGRGISNFAGSIPNRIYNVNLTASKINGVLIPPGATFSFNSTVGDITAATGFKQAYVIKEGRTVLDDGGGVCQDSTTLFRAVLNAGLPVIKRTAHAYRVGYYEQGFPPGLDATVFYPSVDFQFKNDTTSHILIQAYVSGLTLYVDLYGTSDGRAVNLTKSVITNQTPPPPELRQDDPSLPKGTVKQVDFPAWGAQVSFSRTVKRGSETLIKETFKSSYKAWQAVYLVGTKE